jgi:uncharacterized Zn finger protein
MAMPKISEATIRRNANAKSFERGEAYYRAGSVAALTQRGNSIQAEVEGSEVQPYRVTLHFDPGGITSVDCTCAYSFEGWCKHIVATMLVCSRQPEKIEERPTLEQLLDRLNHVQTQRLLQNLVAEQPELMDAIDRHVSQIAAPLSQKTPSKSPRRTTVDPAPFSRQVRQILRDAVSHWEEGWDDDPIEENLLEVIQKAREFSEQGDGNNAIVILEAITAACVEDWDRVADYGADSNGTVEALDEAWTEAILSAELTPEQQVDLRVSLAAWQDELDGNFAMSLEALHQGWDYPPLQRVLQGNVTELGAWEGEPPEFADDLALMRLQILERQERYQEYLYLAEAEGQTQQYLTMLGRLGRIEEAMEAAKTQMQSMEAAFALAQTLRQQEAVEQALEIAQSGLTLAGNCRYDLATWTSDLAEGLDNRQAALAARVVAFKTRPAFGDYRKVEELAGETWSTVKADLLAYLRADQGWGMQEAKVDIFLHEGQIDDAIATVSNLSAYDSALIHRVMDAAIAQHPDWVIENARRRAESIMDEGKADRYYYAVEWLKKARAAYLQAGRRSEWSTYRAKLMQTHARKYKLMGMLKQRDLE